MESLLNNHIKDIVACDFFTVPTATFRVLFVFIILANDRRRIVHFNITEHPTAKWTVQQIVDAFPWDEASRSCPILALQTLHMLKMAVLTHDDQIMCQGHCCNPHVIDRYGIPCRTKRVMSSANFSATSEVTGRMSAIRVSNWSYKVRN